MFNIEIIGVKVESKGKYRVAKVDHKLADGKVDSKQVVSFGAGKAAFTALSDAKQGDVFEIDSQKIKNEKDGKEYWTWVSAASVGKNTGGTPGTRVSPSPTRSNFETSEERAARQVYIVRQSSIANAIEFRGGQGKGNSVEDIIEVAKQFEDYVFNGVKQEVSPAEVS